MCKCWGPAQRYFFVVPRGERGWHPATAQQGTCAPHHSLGSSRGQPCLAPPDAIWIPSSPTIPIRRPRVCIGDGQGDAQAQDEACLSPYMGVLICHLPNGIQTLTGKLGPQVFVFILHVFFLIHFILFFLCEP